MSLTGIKRKHPDALCEECPLYSKPCAPTQGPPQAKVALVSRSPGYYEAMAGKPFSGPSGKVLDFLLNEQGIKREDILVTNAVLCAPDAGKVPPEAIKACAPRVRAELAATELVIAAGSEAVNLLLGRGSIDKYRGYRINRGSDPRTYIATNNPALVLRDDSTFPNLRRDFRRAFNPLPTPTFPTVEVIEDVIRARDFLASIGPGTVSADIESRGGLTHKSELVCLQLGVGGENATVLGEREGLWRDSDFLENHLRPFFEREDINFVWHNGKFDIKILRHTYGIRARVDEDTMLLSYACDERGGVHALEYLLMEEFGWPNYEPKSVKEFKKTGEVLDYDELYTYAGRDVAGTYQLYDLLTGRAKDEGTSEAYKRLLIEGSEALTRVELAGFHFDSIKAGDLMEEEVGPELKRITREMQKVLDNPLFNPRSTKQVQHLYYRQWKCTHAMQKRPDKATSADEAALKEISAGRFKLPIVPATFKKIAERTMNEPVAGLPLTQVAESTYRMVEPPKPIPNESEVRKHIQKFTDLLLRYRELDKTASTYIVGMIKRAEDDPDKKIYTDLLLHGTTSGRLSSRNPNLQNITRFREGLPNIRSLFRASPGRVIVQADYSQAELRCIAQFSQDQKLLQVYKEDLDLHSITAERFYGPEFTKQNRDTSKNCNFGMFYRQSAATFQEKHGIPEAEAQRYINWAKEEFKRVWEWESEIEEEIRRKGVLVSPFGRKRRFHLLTPENLQAVFREGINFYPQTTASDFTLRSLCILSREIDWQRANIVLTVHDSILGDVVESYTEEYRSICKQVMESRPKDELGWEIPFKVDINQGPSWGEVE